MLVNSFIKSSIIKELQRPATLTVFALLFVLITVALTFNQFTANFQNFVYQADGFLNGSVFYKTLPPSLHDSSQVGSNYFWAPGPFPAIVLMPLVVLFGLASLQVYLSMLLVIAVVYLTYLLARQSSFSFKDSLWLATAFTFASIYLGVAMRAQAWQLSSALAAVAALSMLFEYRGRGRPLLIGLAAAATLMTRMTVGLVFLLPLLDTLLNSNKTKEQKNKWLAQALLPIMIAVVILGALNLVRTGSLLDTGYNSAKVSNPLAEVREQNGLFSFKNIPTNIYFYFLTPPRPVFDQNSYQLVPPYISANLVMSFFFLSPIFLYLWRLKLNSRVKKITSGVAGLMTAVILSYYALNAWEFGPRYLVDVLPLYYILLLTCFVDSKLLVRDQILIASSALINLYLFISIPWWSGL